MAHGESEGSTGSFTPRDPPDPSKHQQSRIFEEDHDATGGSAGAGAPAEARFERGEDMISSVGESAGPDTSGALPPAERNRPGASAKLGGTPGATAMSSGGRDTDY